MKILTLRLFFVLILLNISSYCSAYQPTGEYGGFPHGGYTDSRINSNTVVVNYDGSMFTSQKTIENYVLYRCAKIAQDAGFDYFIVVSITTSPDVIHVKTKQNQNDYMTDPPRLFTAYPESNEYESSTSSTTSMRCRYNPGKPCHSEIHGITATIKMFHGHIPRNAHRAYSVTDVISHLQPETF